MRVTTFTEHDGRPEPAVDDAPAWARMEGVAHDLAHRYGFERVDTPLFERVELFARGLGESSDAVEKEMFRVSGARGSNEERAEWALRPEPTAGIIDSQTAKTTERGAIGATTGARR